MSAGEEREDFMQKIGSGVPAGLGDARCPQEHLLSADPGPGGELDPQPVCWTLRCTTQVSLEGRICCPSC